MAIDLAKMKAKLDALRNKGNSTFWRPQDGDQTIRIITPEDGDPFKEKWFHYNLGSSGFLCPKRNFGDECPVCDFASSLWKESSHSDDKEGMKVAKSLFTRQRFFSPVLVRGEEDQGVRVWGYGKTAYEILLNLVLNPEYGDITDLEEGTDLTLNYGKPAGASFPQTKLTPRRRTSPLCDEALGGEDKCAELMESIPDFDSLFDRKSTGDVQSVLDEYLSSEDTEGEVEVVKYDGNKSTSAVDQAFDQLMNA